MTIRKLLKVLLPIVIIVVFAATARNLILGKEKKKQPELQEKVWQVDVIPSKRQSISPSITLYGRIEAPEQMQAAAPGAGIVEKVNVRNGDTALTGDLLLTLDRRDFESQLIQARSDIDEQKSQITELKLRHESNLSSLKIERELLQLTRNDVERMRKLKRQNLGSDVTLSDALSALGRQELSLHDRQLEVDSFPAKLNILESKRQHSMARFEDAKLKIERSEVIAPFNAIISSVPVSVGDRVAIGQALMSLYPLGGLEIKAHIPHHYVASIQAALHRSESLTAQFKSNNRLYRLDLLRLSGDAKATGIDAYFSTGDASQSLRPGELITLNLSLPVAHNVIAIPFQAIYGNARIYLNRDNRLVGIDVETVGQYQTTNNAGENSSRLLIRSESITDDDVIVVTHLPNAITGLKVRTVEHDPAQ